MTVCSVMTVCIVCSTDEDERMQQKARLEDDLSVASERLETLVRGLSPCLFLASLSLLSCYPPYLLLFFLTSISSLWCFPVSPPFFFPFFLLPCLLPFFLIFSCDSLSPPFLSHFLLCFPISSLSFSFSLVLPYLLPFFLIFSCASLSPPFLSHFLSLLWLTPSPLTPLPCY